MRAKRKGVGWKTKFPRAGTLFGVGETRQCRELFILEELAKKVEMV